MHHRSQKSYLSVVVYSSLMWLGQHVTRYLKAPLKFPYFGWSFRWNYSKHEAVPAEIPLTQIGYTKIGKTTTHPHYNSTTPFNNISMSLYITVDALSPPILAVI